MSPSASLTVPRMVVRFMSAPGMTALLRSELLRRDCGSLSPACYRQRSHEGREARGPQRTIRPLQLPAELLDRRDGIVADAVDREEHLVGSADEPRQQRDAVLDAAVVVEEARSHALHHRLHIRHLV